MLSTKVVGDGIQQQWITYAYPNCKLSITGYPGMQQAGGTNSNPMTITVTPNMSTRFPWGALLSTGTNAFANNRSDYMAYRADYPLGLTTHVADIGDTQFVTGYRPKSADVADSNNKFGKDGVAFTPTSITPATGVVVIPSATAQEIYIAMYETMFVAI